MFKADPLILYNRVVKAGSKRIEFEKSLSKSGQFVLKTDSIDFELGKSVTLVPVCGKVEQKKLIYVFCYIPCLARFGSFLDTEMELLSHRRRLVTLETYKNTFYIGEISKKEYYFIDQDALADGMAHFMRVQ